MTKRRACLLASWAFFYELSVKLPGIIVVAATAAAFNLPTEGVAILLGIDRLLDMIRTICNVCGNCMATVVVACWEKELNKATFNEKYRAFLGGKNR